MIRVRPLDPPGREIVGIAFGRKDGATLMRRSDEAFYEVTKRSKGTIRFHRDVQPVVLMDHSAPSQARGRSIFPARGRQSKIEVALMKA